MVYLVLEASNGVAMMAAATGTVQLGDGFNVDFGDLKPVYDSGIVVKDRFTVI